MSNEQQAPERSGEVATQVTAQICNVLNSQYPAIDWPFITIRGLVVHALTSAELRGAELQREVDAGIVESAAMLASPDGVIPEGDPEHERLTKYAETLSKAAAAIRAAKQQ